MRLSPITAYLFLPLQVHTDENILMKYRKPEVCRNPDITCFIIITDLMSSFICILQIQHEIREIIKIIECRPLILNIITDN